MKIDTHQHYWHYMPEAFPWIDARMPVLQRDCLPGDVIAAMQACDVAGAMAVQASSQAQETDFLLQLAQQHSKIVGVVGWTDLRADDLPASLERWSGQRALKGFRHIVQDEPDVAQWLTDPQFNRGVALLQSRQLVYDVLVFDHQLPLAVDFCARHDAHWLVLDHVGKPAVRDWADKAQVRVHWSRQLRALGQLPHLMCKLSGLVTETDWSATTAVQDADLHETDVRSIMACFDLALEVFGPDRLMFGSDWPVCQLAAPYEAVHGMAKTWAQSRLTQQEQQAFWGGNAQRCYGLTLQAASA
jgi:L-fuconolactonase